MEIEIISRSLDGAPLNAEEIAYLHRIHYRTILASAGWDEGDRYGQLFVEKMIGQSQTELEQAEIATVSAVDDLVPPRVHGVRPKMNNSEVGKTGGDRRSRQTLRI